MGFFNFEEGFADGYSAVIDKVEFAPNNFGQLQATITNLRDEPFTGKEGQLVTTSPVWVTVGSTSEWEACDGGTDFRHVSGDEKKRPRSNSQWATLLTRIVDLIGVDAALAREVEGRQAPNLVGLHLDWDNEGAGKDYSFTDKTTGEKKEGKTKGRLMPIGVAGEAKAGTTAAVLDLAALDLPAQLEADLRTLASLHPAPKFMAEAINVLPQLAEAGWDRTRQDAFIGYLGNGSLYAALGGDQ